MSLHPPAGMSACTAGMCQTWQGSQCHCHACFLVPVFVPR